jgi:hypothetical protein
MALRIFFCLLIVVVVIYVNIKHVLPIIRFRNGVDAVNYFYKIIYEYCQKTDSELIDELVNKERKNEILNSDGKTVEKVVLEHGQFKIVVHQGSKKEELLIALQVILEEVYALSEKIDQKIVFLTEVSVEKSNIADKICKVKVLLWKGLD